VGVAALKVMMWGDIAALGVMRALFLRNFQWWMSLLQFMGWDFLPEEC
jgi:hypothetical protein